MSILRKKGLFSVGLMSLTTCSSVICETEENPNIIFIMADDIGYGDVSCYSTDCTIPTPNMDKLAKQGVIFTDAHSASSVSTPSRYSAITGRYCWRTRLKSEVLWSTFDEPLIEKNRMTVASLAKKHGYKTACIGKWHLGMNFYKKNSDQYVRGKRKHHYGKKGSRDVDFDRPAEYSPNDLGFDFSFISGAGHNMEPHCFIQNRKPTIKPTVWREAKVPTIKGSSARESHEGWMSPGWIDEQADIEFTKVAVDYIDRVATKNTKEPFFMYLTPVSPHRPCVPIDKFKGVTGKGLREDYVAQLDWTVGEIIQILDKKKIADNTILIVTSDNGAVQGTNGHKSNGNFNGKKSSLHEGGHRVPFIVRWPMKIEKGTVNNSLICSAGLLATMADILKEKLPDNAGEDSFSFKPSMLGKNISQPVIIHQSYFGTLAVREGKWKLLPNAKKLYDMKNDPYETTNLYSENVEIVEKLSSNLKRYKDCGRTRPVTK